VFIGIISGLEAMFRFRIPVLDDFGSKDRGSHVLAAIAMHKI
jgi:hypothetical protein